MFDYIYEWIQNIAFYLVLVTAVLHAVPNKDYKKYIRFFYGACADTYDTDTGSENFRNRDPDH